jgi:hypothetical protein
LVCNDLQGPRITREALFSEQGPSNLTTRTLAADEVTGLELLDVVGSLGLNQSAVLIQVNFCHLGATHDFGRGLFLKVLI